MGIWASNARKLCPAVPELRLNSRTQHNQGFSLLNINLTKYSTAYLRERNFHGWESPPVFNSSSADARLEHPYPNSEPAGMDRMVCLAGAKRKVRDMGSLKVQSTFDCNSSNWYNGWTGLNRIRTSVPAPVWMDSCKTDGQKCFVLGSWGIHLTPDSGRRGFRLGWKQRLPDGLDQKILVLLQY